MLTLAMSLYTGSRLRCSAAVDASLKINRYLPDRCAFFGGSLSVVVQAVVLREALFGQHQAELASGIVLAAWIAGSGLGAALGGRTSRHRSLWTLGIVLMPLLGFLQVAASRQGVIHPAFSVLPVGFIAGSVFISPFAFGRTGKIYGLEALGAAVGGGIFVLLSPVLLSGEILAVSVLMSASGLLLCGIALPGSILSGVLIISVILGAPSYLNSAMGSMIPGEYETYGVHASPYGEVVTTSRSGQHAVFRSGLLETTWPSLESAEGTVTVPLIVSMPVNALYIGSSPEEAGIISHWPGVERLLTVVPDEALSRVAEYPGEVVTGDGRHFLSEDRSHWDLIMVSTGQPLTLLSNRFFTCEFMALLSSRISSRGIAVVHLPGGINRLHPLEAELAGTVTNSAKRSFDWVRVIPGSGLLLLAGNGEGPVVEGSRLAMRMDSAGGSGVFVNPGTLPFDLSPMRLSAVEAQIEAQSAGMNADLKPDGFRIAHELWDFREGRKSDVGILIGASVVLLIVMNLAGFLSGTFRSSVAVGLIGFSGLSVEAISLVAIQSATGYSWVLVGAVTGIFMSGGALGALCQDRGLFRDLRLMVILAGAAVFSTAAVLQMYHMGLVGESLLAVLLLIGVFTSGLASGGAFPLAAVILGKGNTAKIGLLDLAEHGGSAAAALLMPLVLFPLLGAAAALLCSLAVMITAGMVLGKR